MIKVSIIMGIYNCEDTVSEAIDSVLAQTLTEWELILCDDGSTDKTCSIAQEYVERYPKTIVLIRNQTNQGLNYTLNHCLKYARGKYIARMDADDLSVPERLEKEASFLDQHTEFAIVSCPMIYFDENGDWGRGNCIKTPTAMDFVAGTPFCHAPCMVRREAYEAVGGYSTDPRTLRAEDYDLWFRMYELGYKGYNLSEPLYKMRDDQNAYRRRKLKYALNESYVRRTGYKRLGLPKRYYLYSFRPIVVALLPKPLYLYLHHRKKRMQ